VAFDGLYKSFLAFWPIGLMALWPFGLFSLLAFNGFWPFEAFWPFLQMLIWLIYRST
jgi:hypothetical protein